MKSQRIIFLALLFFISATVLYAKQSKDLAIQAVRAQDYDRAIAICLDYLNTHPEDSDVHFILAQAYAYSDSLPEALSLLEKMMDTHPENLDALLLWSRIRAWQNEYEAAENGFRRVLLIDEGNIEAKIGLAETASWKGEYRAAMSIYQDLLQQESSNPEIHYRLGRVFEWQGNYAQAKENFRAAIRMVPDNEKYRKALSSSRPQFRDRFEVRYLGRSESFSDKRDPYWDQSLAFLLASPENSGNLLFKANQTHRLNDRDLQFGVEYYPRLWKGAYGAFELSYSPKALRFPRTSTLVEVYQSFFSTAEFSLGYRRMSFDPHPVSLYLGSLGYYFGNYYSFVRWYYSLQNKENTFSWTVNLRRYFSQDNYVFVAFGQGSRPFEAATADDFLIAQSRRIQAGVIWYILRHIRLEFHLQFTDELDGPNRTAIFLSSGYRW